MSDFIISCDFDLTDAIKNHVNSELQALKKYLPEESHFSVYLSRDAKSVFHSKLSVRVWKHDLFAEDQSDDLYKSITATKNKLSREIKDLKDRFEAKKKHN